MTVFGVSQSSGVERRLKVERGGQGLVLSIVEHPAGIERERIMVQTESLMAGIIDPPLGGTTVEGVGAPAGSKTLEIEVRRNEVWITARGTGEGTDIAVGLDDFQDALEAVMVRS